MHSSHLIESRIGLPPPTYEPQSLAPGLSNFLLLMRTVIRLSTKKQGGGEVEKKKDGKEGRQRGWGGKRQFPVFWEPVLPRTPPTTTTRYKYHEPLYLAPQ